MNVMESWILLYVLLGVALFALGIYIQWYFIKSAVKSGTKEAIRETYAEIKNIEKENAEQEKV